MGQHPIDGIAAVIRQYPNVTDPDVLGAAIAAHIDGGPSNLGFADVVAGIIRHANPDNTMGAGALAEVIHNDLNA